MQEHRLGDDNQHRNFAFYNMAVNREAEKDFAAIPPKKSLELDTTAPRRGLTTSGLHELGGQLRYTKYHSIKRR